MEPQRKVEFEVTAHTFQIDFAGHVNNGVYLQWMDIGRTKLLEAAGMPIPSLLHSGVVPILASTAIEYKKPLALGDRVRVQVWLSALTAATARIEVRFFDGNDALVASGWHRGAFVDTDRGRPVRISSQWKEAFAPFLGG